MAEYFVVTNSNAAPFFSDTDEFFVEADSSWAARDKAIAEYKHPAGLFSLAVYENANEYHKGHSALETWKSERAIKQFQGRA